MFLINSKHTANGKQLAHNLRQTKILEKASFGWLKQIRSSNFEQDCLSQKKRRRVFGVLEEADWHSLNSPSGVRIELFEQIAAAEFDCLQDSGVAIHTVRHCKNCSGTNGLADV